jgi:hypothetical protein
MTDEIRLSTRGFVRSLEGEGRAFERDALRTLSAAVATALRHARTSKLFKDKTTELRRTLTKGQTSTWRWFIRAPAKHALYVEHDTKAHRITARKASVLRFVQNGRVRFAHSVWHPGTTGTHFMAKAGEAGERALERGLRRVVGSSFRRTR